MTDCDEEKATLINVSEKNDFTNNNMQPFFYTSSTKVDSKIPITSSQCFLLINDNDSFIRNVFVNLEVVNH